LSCQEYLNRKTLIVGDVQTGKTKRTLRILRDLLGCGNDAVAVLDLAPEKVQGIGGKVPLSFQEKEQVLYLSPRIIPPRLFGKSKEEIQALAQENCQRIEHALQVLREKVLSCLIINDVSLYLHEGSAEQLLSSVGKISTLLMNGYYGGYFGDCFLSRRERAQMEILMSHCHQVIFLPSLLTSFKHQIP
jgi:hypothetical protein